MSWDYQCERKWNDHRLRFNLGGWFGGSKGNETASSIGALEEPGFEHMGMHLLKLGD